MAGCEVSATIYTIFRSINEVMNIIKWLTVVQLRILEQESAVREHCYEGWRQDEKPP